MKYEGVDHTCDFKLEQTSQGYFTGYFVCTFCGIKLSQTQWLDTIELIPTNLVLYPKLLESRCGICCLHQKP
jgi:hypothetical protein